MGIAYKKDGTVDLRGKNKGIPGKAGRKKNPNKLKNKTLRIPDDLWNRISKDNTGMTRTCFICESLEEQLKKIQKCKTT